MSRRDDDAPYVLEETRDGFAIVQPVTGLRLEGRDPAVLIADMHRAMLDRRDELADRDPAGLDADERRDLEHLASYADAFLRVGLLLGEPLPPRLPDGSLPAVGPWPSGLPYELERRPDGTCVLRDPVTGLRAEHREYAVAVDRMHRRMLDRRAELEARDPDALTDEDRRHLERLRGCPDAVLEAGLLSAGLIA